eukprot:221939-Rhodomonas_salina.2
MVLRIRYAISGTKVQYAASHFCTVLRTRYAISGTNIQYAASHFCIVLRTRYGMSGTDLDISLPGILPPGVNCGEFTPFDNYEVGSPLPSYARAVRCPVLR